MDIKESILPITQHHSIEELRELHRDALHDLKALLLRRASFSISQFSSSRESKGIILTVDPHTEEIVVTGKTPEMSRALEKVTEDLLIKNIGHQSDYDHDLYCKISEHLNNSMEKYIDIQHGNMKDRKRAYSKLIQENIAFIKTTQGHIMSSRSGLYNFRSYFHYPSPILELLLDIEQKTFRIESIELKYHQEKALQSDVSVKKRKMIGTEIEMERLKIYMKWKREMAEIERMEIEMEMERVIEKRIMERGMMEMEMRGVKRGMEIELERKRRRMIIIYKRKMEDMNMMELEVYQELLIKELHRVAQEQLDYYKWCPLQRIADVELVIQRMIVIENRIKIN